MSQKRMEQIRNMINDRKERGEVKSCVFYITVPKSEDIRTNPVIRKMETMLDKNQVTHGHVDTLPGAWNLNRDWIETGEMDCIVEYGGVYPIAWDLVDVVEMERMEVDGEIIIMVDWIVDGEHIPNN